MRLFYQGPRSLAMVDFLKSHNVRRKNNLLLESTPGNRTAPLHWKVVELNDQYKANPCQNN